MNSWLARSIRGRRLDRNPLRRPADRAETVIVIVLLVLFGVLAPFAAHAADTGTRAIAGHIRSTALATRHEVTAVTLQPTPAMNPDALVTQSFTGARWTAPDEQPRAGQVLVDDGTPAGAAVVIWVDAGGTQASPPLPGREIAGLADLAAAAGVFMLALLLLAVAAVARRRLDRRRMTAWDDEWAATGPRWDRQR